MKAMLKCALIACTLFSAHASASLIVHYDFNDGTGNNSLDPNYNLTEVGNAIYSQGAYYSDGKSGNYLHVAGPGGSDNWVVSLWARADVASAGFYSALFSNNYGDASDHEIAEESPYRWQIDQHQGKYTLRTTTGKKKGDQFVRKTQTLGYVLDDTWQHIVVQKFNNQGTRLFLDGRQVFETDEFIPGGLQNFNVGINRNRDNAFSGYIDDIQVWNFGANETLSARVNGFDINEFVATEYATRVPTPSVLSLFSLGLVGLFIRRKLQQ